MRYFQRVQNLAITSLYLYTDVFPGKGTQKGVIMGMYPDFMAPSRYLP